MLYVDGCPAGYFELDSSRMPDDVEIAYFGLIGKYTGMGLGHWFLGAAIDAAWDRQPQQGRRPHQFARSSARTAAVPEDGLRGGWARSEEEVEAWED